MKDFYKKYFLKGDGIENDSQSNYEIGYNHGYQCGYQDLFPYIDEMRKALKKYKKLNGLNGPAEQALKNLYEFVGDGE